MVMDTSMPLIFLMKEGSQLALRYGVLQKTDHSFECMVLAQLKLIGGAQGCFDRTIPYVMQRKQFGKTVWTFQVCCITVRILIQHDDMEFITS
jgi:hypothetical protein